MRTKENYRGEQFDVTYDKLFRTSEGMGFVLKREEDIEPRMMEVLNSRSTTLTMNYSSASSTERTTMSIGFSTSRAQISKLIFLSFMAV